MDRVLFNLLFNGALSFLAGLLIISFVIWAFKITDSRWKLFFLSLPFLKILWDLVIGIPSDSTLFSSINPWALPPKHKTLFLGAGFAEFGPILSLGFSLRDPAGPELAISVPDFLYYWLAGLSRHVPTILLCVTMFISVVLIGRRLLSAVRFEVQRLRASRSKSTIWLPSEKVAKRTVKIFVTPEFEGTPFTGGIFRPYICFPKSTYDEFTSKEREAVIRHELAHIRHLDLPITIALKIMGDLFWFIPGYFWLGKRIDRLREILADRLAVSFGASSVHLASAILKTREATHTGKEAILYSALARNTPLLKERVEMLTGKIGNHAARNWWKRRWVRCLAGGWTTGAVMASTFGGNYHHYETPDWIERIWNMVAGLL